MRPELTMKNSFSALVLVPPILEILETFSTFLFCPVGIYLFKVNNRNNSKMCEICLKLTVKTPNNVIDDGISLVNYSQVNAGWIVSKFMQ